LTTDKRLLSIDSTRKPVRNTAELDDMIPKMLVGSSHSQTLKPKSKLRREADDSPSVKSMSSSLTSVHKPVAPLLNRTKSESLPKTEPLSSERKPIAPSSPAILYTTKI
jgi:hypothetical protein